MVVKDRDRRNEIRRKTYWKNHEKNKEKGRNYYYENRAYILDQKRRQRENATEEEKEKKRKANKRWGEKRRTSRIRLSPAEVEAIERMKKKAEDEVEVARQAGLAARKLGKFKWNGERGENWGT